MKTHRILAPLAVLTLVLGGCATAKTATAPTDSSRIAVLATTNVYAAVATAVGGSAVTATAVLNDPSADPHSYEATPQVAQQVSAAQVLVSNGGGYDDFAKKLVDAAPKKPVVITAVKLLDQADKEHHDHDGHSHTSHDRDGHGDGHQHEHGAVNEHVFYHLPTMRKLAEKLASTFSELAPSQADTFTRNAKAFSDSIDTLAAKAAGIAQRHNTFPAVLTEPVANYLLQSAGISDITPAAFTKAVENQTDPSVKDIASTTELIRDKKAKLLVVNKQTSGPVIEKLVTTAKQAGVPILEVTETLPAGVTDYASWIEGTLTALDKALS